MLALLDLDVLWVKWEQLVFMAECWLPYVNISPGLGTSAVVLL